MDARAPLRLCELSMGTCWHGLTRLAATLFPPAATRAISQDEEITISYVDPEKPSGERRRHLRHTYDFICCCKRCIAGERFDRCNGCWVSDTPYTASSDSGRVVCEGEERREVDVGGVCEGMPGRTLEEETRNEVVDEEALDALFDALSC